MRGKTILLLGLVITALFIYLCIDSKKDAFYAELVEKKEVRSVASVIIPKEKKEELLTPAPAKNPLKEASFAYVTGEKTKIAGILSQEDNTSEIVSSIEKICEKNNCIKDIQFVTYVAPFHFSKDTLGLIENAKKEKIKDFALYIDKKSLKIEGKLTDKAQEETINSYLESFLDAGYTIENEIRVEAFIPVTKEKFSVKVKEPKIKIIKEEIIVEAPRDIFVTPQHLTIEEAEENINSIISSNTITFDYRSSDISRPSKDTLNEVIDILLGLDNTTIQVAGYTDSKGGTIYNKVLSQKRADAVRTYLIKSGVRASLIKSKGYGEENPIGAPEDVINRRVEIHVQEGK